MQTEPIKWATTSNTLEAAALASIGVGVKAVSGIEHGTHNRFTEWCLKPLSEPEIEGDPVYVTGALRRDTKTGELEKTTPLHPYLISLRGFLNRERILDAMKGKSQRAFLLAPGLYELKPGSVILPPGTLQFKTHDIDVTTALVTCGCQIIKIEKEGRDHVFFLTRFPFIEGGHELVSGILATPAPRFDALSAATAYRAQQLWPARRHEPFAIVLHALHSLRELRKKQHSEEYLIVRHKTPFMKGAAIRTTAGGDALGQVQKTLNVRL